ncbi:MAG: hypothetical protein CVV64_14805 [Candidatus Wallbacteria bacterium HGW-Wallbacteria-1]|uniref:Uncharacterized protein n=1 Tax=Candidatus Wallbacteria bacterium HGW-Wallbacteria-1 TaxID=2013854 RepID=A0A2N1PLW4_9BACT|nr:MAG: hypothetical protein CVV64_14805 [Candidatus Wallbacteria bacterium HGW-Wallbacteria-1]
MKNSTENAPFKTHNSSTDFRRATTLAIFTLLFIHCFPISGHSLASTLKVKKFTFSGNQSFSSTHQGPKVVKPSIGM